ncbi:MAG TPA: DUF4124 domain-containing protein [Usitatibacter sp.]|jgi:hypothetical protein|nr:DUF4124 domain-containing protein [Usitatibacter sp.]
MDVTRHYRPALLAAIAAAIALPVPAAMLYKSIGPNGVVQFSDLPPEKGQVVAQMVLPDRDAAPKPGAGAPVAPPEEFDAALQKANVQLDLAEHSLATARRPVWSEPDVIHIVSRPIARPDRERIAYYEKNVRLARLAVADLMRRKLKADASTATMTASNEWVAVRPEDRR